jgi:hypothetical protein
VIELGEALPSVAECFAVRVAQPRGLGIECPSVRRRSTDIDPSHDAQFPAWCPGRWPGGNLPASAPRVQSCRAPSTFFKIKLQTKARLRTTPATKPPWLGVCDQAERVMSTKRDLSQSAAYRIVRSGEGCRATAADFLIAVLSAAAERVLARTGSEIETTAAEP